jgi:hypothetical protein
MAMGMGVPKEVARIQFIEKMVQPVGPPPKGEE